MANQIRNCACKYTVFGALFLAHYFGPWLIVHLPPRLDIGSPTAVLALLAAQVALLSIWTVLGPGRWFVRLPIAGGLLALLLWHRIYRGGYVHGAYENYTIGRPYFAYEPSLLFCQAAILIVVLIALRYRGGRIQQLLSTEVELNPPLRWRWSLRTLILTIAIAAAAAKLGLIARSYWLNNAVSRAIITGSCQAILTAALALICLWAVLRPPSAYFRLLCLGTIGGIVAFFCLTLASDNYQDETERTLRLLGYEAAFISATLLVVRHFGYRLSTDPAECTRLQRTETQSTET
jgi:hypothetical protein